MKINLNYLLAGSFSVLGAMCITSGIVMPKLVATTETNEVVKLNVTQKKVTVCKSNEIKLKDLVIEINNPLSTNVKDYLKTPSDIDSSIIKNLKLDTSNVKISEVGIYTYTITYNKKIYNGSVSVKAKPLPQVDIMTLKSFSLEAGTKLSVNISDYIQEKLPMEVIVATKLDISNVNVNKPGSYLYSISYNGKLYTNTITIYEPKYGNVIVDTNTNNNNNNNIVDNKTNTTVDGKVENPKTDVVSPDTNQNIPVEQNKNS